MIEFLWFLFGALTFHILSALLYHGRMFLFVQEITVSCLELLKAAAEDAAFMRNIKYEFMDESGCTEDQIKKIRDMDENSFLVWKRFVIRSFLTFYPRRYIASINFKDWESAMKCLKDTRRERENER